MIGLTDRKGNRYEKDNQENCNFYYGNSSSCSRFGWSNGKCC